MPYVDPEKQKQFQRERVARIRAAWFSDKCCVECGSKTDLELDHIDPAQKLSHRIWSWSVEKRSNELIKCQVLCQDCHLKKTLAARKKAEHGKDWMYDQGCRCDLCREFKRQKNSKRKR